MSHPEDLDRLLHSIEDSYETPTPWQHGWRIITPSGQLKWLRGTSLPELLPNGDVMWDGIVIDNTKQKQAETQLIHSRALQSTVIHILQNLLKNNHQDFEAILYHLAITTNAHSAFIVCHNTPEQNPKVVCEWQEGGTKLDVCDCFQNLNLTSQDWWLRQVLQNENITINYLDSLPLEAHDLKINLKEKGLQSLLGIPILKEKGRAWGVLCIAFQTAHPKAFPHEETQVLKLVGEMLYIASERESKKSLLETSEIQFREIFENAGVGIAKLDPNFHFTQINETLAKMIGSQHLDHTGEHFSVLTPSDELAGDRQMFQDVQEQGFVQREMPIYHSLGRKIWVRINMSQVQSRSVESLYYIAIFEDISQRKLSEELNALLEIRDQSLITALGEVTYDHYLPEDILTWKGDYEKILGYTTEEIGMDTATWFANVHPHDLPSVKKAFATAKANKTIFDIEYRYRCKNGEYLWMHDRGVIHGPKDGPAERFIGVFRDISQRKDVEEELRASEENYRQIVETAQEGIWVLDQQAITTYVNPQMSSMLGYETTEMIGRTVYDFMPKDEVDLGEEYVKENLMGLSGSHDFRFQHRDGSDVWTMLSTNPLLKDDGKVHGALGMLTNITDRKLAEQEVVRNRDLREAIFNESTDALFLVDSETLLVFDCNQKAIEMFERDKKEELLNIKGHELQQKQFSAEEMEQIVQDINEKGSWSRELEYVTKSGRIFWGSLAAKQITVGDRHMNFVRVTDIDDRKKAEQELRRTNEELARATKLKDEFLANMSHELRTPLNAILGLTEVLESGTFGGLTERQRRSLSTIERNGQHLLELINDILNLAKIEAGQIDFNPMPVEVTDLCNMSVLLIRHQASQKKIDINLDLPSNSPIINADPLRLRQALINLISNAIKFTSKTGKIDIAIELQPEQEQVKICIRDNGIGIKESDLDKLFQPFVQLDSSLTRRFSGTGLGLALVKQIVELHHGSIAVTSTLGQGSAFCVSLPWQNARQKSEPVPIRRNILPGANSSANSDQLPPDSPEISDRPLILVVDDDDDNIETLWDYLLSRGYELIRAANGREAIAQAQSHRPDLILMDIKMPELNGLDATSIIRETFSADQMPIIALTALAMDGDRKKCLEAGANLYLAKPFRLRTLTEEIATLLRAETNP